MRGAEKRVEGDGKKGGGWRKDGEGSGGEKWWCEV